MNTQLSSAILYVKQSMSDRYAKGMKIRRKVLGDSHVDAAESSKTSFDEAFQTLITERTPVARSRGTKRKRTLEEANRNQERKQQKDQWRSAVTSAVSDQKRKTRWMKVGRIATSGVSGL